MTPAFFGFLCIGELTCDSHFNPERHLSFSDLVFMPKSSPRYMLVQLKASKTDPCRKRQTIVIGKAISHLSAMLAYLESRTPFPTTGPLFTFQFGSFLTRGRLTNEIQVNLPVTVSVSVQLPQLTYPLGSVGFRAMVLWLLWTIPAQVPQTLTELLWCLLFLSIEIFLFYCVNGGMLCICGDEVLLSTHFCPHRLLETL